MARKKKPRKKSRRKPPDKRRRRTKRASRKGAPRRAISLKAETKILELLRQGQIIEDAAATLGVSSRTIRRHRADFPKFEERFLDAAMVANNLVISRLFKRAQADGEVSAIRLWLYNRDPENWKSRQEHEIHGQGPVTVIFERGTLEEPDPDADH